MSGKVVVAAILPSLIILSRTPTYTIFRLSGAMFAGFVSSGWIVERLFGVPDSVDVVVDHVAQRGAWIAASLIVISIVTWFRHDRKDNRNVITERPALTESEAAVR